MNDPTNNVFINCPYDTGYHSMFEALIFGVMACGFTARSARETDDGGQSRMEKIYTIIEQCRFGVHDISRTELDPVNNLPRFNMPFELGAWLGAKHFGNDEQRAKSTMILDVEPHRHRLFISDLSGRDPHDHGGDPKVALRKLRDWLRSASKRTTIKAAPVLIAAYQQFIIDRNPIAEAAGYDPANIPYVDFTEIVANWLVVPR